MSLKLFHVVFVSLSTLLAFVFAGWNLHAYRTVGGAAYLVPAIASALAGVGMIFYGFWFWRKITTREEERRRRRKKFHTVPALLAVWLLSTRVAPACTVCYGEADGPLIDSARMGVWLLFGMTAVMQGCFVAFFIYLWRRAKKMRREPVAPWWFKHEG